jgi:KTSC domain
MKIVFVFIFIAGIYSCNAQECKMPVHFASYEVAMNYVRHAGFKVSESVNTSKSSWVRSAEYYSCDGKTGFFILGTDKKEYIFKDVPREIWDGFKNAVSFGSYYNQYIRGRYFFKL